MRVLDAVPFRIILVALSGTLARRRPRMTTTPSSSHSRRHRQAQPSPK